MPAQDGAFDVGEVMQLVGIAGFEGVKVTVVRNLAKDKWAVTVDGEDKKSKVVSSRNLQKISGSAGPPKNYCIVGTWDEWESHEMAWDPSEGCFEYSVLIGSTGTESFKMLVDGDWDLCVYPDKNDANPHEEHSIKGPDDGGSDVEWTIGARREDRSHEGARFKVRFFVSPSGKPLSVQWEAPGAERAQERGTTNGHASNGVANGASTGMRTSVKDLLKKGPGHREEEPPAPPPPREERAAPKRSMLPRSLGKKASDEPAPAAVPSVVTNTAIGLDAVGPPHAAPPRAAAPPKEERAPEPAEVASLASVLRDVSKPLGTVLREARPSSTAQELAMTKSKLLKISVKSSEDLYEALKAGQVQERLKGAGLTAFPNDLVEDLAAFFNLPAKGAPVAPAPAPAKAETAPAPAKAETGAARPRGFMARAQAALKAPKAQLWEVVGGAESSGGVLVREGSDKSSKALDLRLATGSLIEEIELSDGRLHYKRRSGAGPDEGWILIELKGKELAKRVDEAEDHQAAAEPAAQEDAPARQAETRQLVEQPAERPAELSLELKQKAQRLKVDLDKLHNHEPNHVAEFLDKMERVHKTTASKLQAQYAELGFPVDEDDVPERAEMARQVSKVLEWQELALVPLQAVCAQKGLEVEMDQSREELLQLLSSIEWENAGIPITRLEKTEDGLAVFSQMRGIENAGPNKLVAECKRLGLPTSASEDTMISALKQAFIWKVLPAPELLRECKAYSLTPQVGDLSQESTRDELYQQLVNCMWGNRCEARGIPAKRLGSSHLAEELLAKVDRLQVLGIVSLQMEYRKMGITFDPKLDTQALIDRLRDMLIWESLPLGELQEECRLHGLPQTDGRKAMLQRLRKRLDDELELEAQGLPVRRLGGYEAALELMEQYEAIEQMTMEELIEWYKGTGCPEEKGLPKDELMELLKAMAVWEALPLTELTQECAQNKVAVKDLKRSGSEDEQREQLVTKLMQQQRMRVWEERGFKAERIGDFHAVSQLIRKYNHLDSMSNEDLERAYTEKGMPKEAGMDRSAMLENLKMVLVWEALPLLDLQMDCLERSDKIQCDFESTGNENEQRASLVRQLIVESFRTAYEELGVPVERIGFLEAYSVGKDLVSFTIMSEQELQAECQKLGLAANSEMTCSELLARLREYTLWDVMSADDLFAECQRRGIQEQLREQILGLLLAQPA